MFGIAPNVPVMHQVVTAQLAARRGGTQSTKTRAEVAGGGSKPWRQKGTGRSRQGSTNAPQWRGGGVAMGPKPRSYRQRTPKKMVQLALRSALSDRAADGKVLVVDGWSFDEPSTKEAVAALAKLEVDGKVLLVLGRGRPADAWLSFRNLPDVHCLLRPRAQRLRRARVRLDRVHQGDPPRQRVEADRARPRSKSVATRRRRQPKPQTRPARLPKAAPARRSRVAQMTPPKAAPASPKGEWRRRTSAEWRRRHGGRVDA